MQRLFLFIYQNRAFATFILLEVICAWMIIQNNRYQGVAFFNTSNRFAAGLVRISTNISGYFALRDVNEKLSEENAMLKKRLNQRTQSLFQLDIVEERDPEILNSLEYLSAKVINNSTRRFKNYLTVDKGTKDGIEPGMAVINGTGVVGKVKSVSKNFAVVYSLLHTDVMVSTKVDRTDDLCSVNWGGKDIRMANLMYVPRHTQLQVGDSVTTSGFNAIFPAEVLVGWIEEFSTRDDALFHDVKVKLANDFNKLAFVYVVKNRLLMEQDSLQSTGEILVR